MPYKDIIALVRKPGRIALLPHIEADGDALGSCLALYIALIKEGCDVSLLLEEKVPENYLFLPRLSDISVYRNESGYDLAVAVDTGDTDRLGRRKSIFDEAASTINIDHHATNSMFAQINCVDTGKAASGEIIYDIITAMGCVIDKEIAGCIYTAITTDTGSFRYSNTTPATHIIASKLLETGIDAAEISRRVFDVVSYEKTILTGLAIKTIKMVDGGKISMITVSNEMMRESGAGEEDCEGLVNIGRNIAGVEVAVLLREKENNLQKVNLRSNTETDVSAIAAHFGGGGHKKAAGCNIPGNIDDARQQILSAIRRVIK